MGDASFGSANSGLWQPSHPMEKTSFARALAFTLLFDDDKRSTKAGALGHLLGWNSALLASRNEATSKSPPTSTSNGEG
eukprot:1191121-Prymnesium_polylepis.2